MLLMICCVLQTVAIIEKRAGGGCDRKDPFLVLLSLPLSLSSPGLTKHCHSPTTPTARAPPTQCQPTSLWCTS